MSFTVRPLPALPDVQLITPRVFTDDRGVFFESWRSAKDLAGAPFAAAELFP